MAYYAFTSITLNYLPKARVLAHSLKRWHPEIQFHLLVSETDLQPFLSDKEPFDEVTSIKDLGIGAKLNGWVFRHSVVEICTAVKGVYTELLLTKSDCEGVLYFDPDIVVLGSLETLLAAFSKGSILLTPHQTEPEETVEGVLDNEVCCLRHGVFNLGFLAVKPSAEGLRFARWWNSRLRSFCYADAAAGLFTDQKWVDLAPALFSEVVVLRSPSFNVATWNLTQRTVTGTPPDKLIVNGEPLVFYHFSGIDSGDQLTMLFKYGKRMPALFRLRDWYINECAKYGQQNLGSLRWAFGYFENGESISPSHRRLYRQRADLQEAFPDPFVTNDIDRSYYHWYEAHAK